MKKLTIPWQDLELAFEDPGAEFELSTDANYFDLESGNVVFINDDISTTVDLIIDEMQGTSDDVDGFSEDSIRATETFQKLAGPEQRNVLAAIQIEYGDCRQFAKIPTFDADDSYHYMEDFIETVSDDAMRSRLSKAIAQRKPFRHFREVLAGERRLQRRWRAFEIARQRETVIEWLHSIGVEPANREAWKFDPPPLPDLRRIMFTEVRRFVCLARDIPGVLRIALIGSLTTDKEFPKDIDLLVTVSDDCDLTPLAKQGRKLSGHMASHQAGADIFLTNPRGDYLGRTCPWKNCGVGYRSSCDAMGCGQRHYLHDDFEAIRLKRDVISDPPVMLWPNLAATVDVPTDVQEQLIEPLAMDEDR